MSGFLMVGDSWKDRRQSFLRAQNTGGMSDSNKMYSGKKALLQFSKPEMQINNEVRDGNKSGSYLPKWTPQIFLEGLSAILGKGKKDEEGLPGLPGCSSQHNAT